MIAPFGTTKHGEKVEAVTITAGGITARILSWGAALNSLRLAGVDHDLTLGSDTLSDYEDWMHYHGVIIGPIANRIRAGRVVIDGMSYELERNQSGRITLHSGSSGTHRRIWQITDHGPAHVTLTCTLGDGDAGLPGHRVITARYSVTTPATLTLEITATTDAATLMNFAHHGYWTCDGTAPFDGHRLWVAADTYLPIDADTCPTGEIAPVDGSPFDFRTPREIAVDLPFLDHNFCLSDQQVDPRPVARLTGRSGTCLTVETDQPGLQIYNGDGAQAPGSDPHAAIAIEPQGWPDAPAHRHFPRIRVTPDAPYRQVTRYLFSRNATE